MEVQVRTSIHTRDLECRSEYCEESSSHSCNSCLLFRYKRDKLPYDNVSGTDAHMAFSSECTAVYSQDKAIHKR